MRKEVNDIIEKLLKEKGLTKEELVFDKLFCIRKYKPQIDGENELWYEIKRSSLGDIYPKEDILEFNSSWSKNQKRVFEKEYRQMMSKIYDEYSSKKDLDQMCYNIIEFLMDGILTGYADILKNKDLFEKYYKKEEICKEVEDYIKNNGYFEKIGRKQNFSYCSYSWFTLVKFENLNDLHDEIYKEILDFIETYCCYIFLPEKFTNDELFEKEISASIKQVSYSLSVLEGKEKERYKEEIKKLLEL